MKQVIILIILMFVLALGGCQSAKERHSVKSNVVVHETLDTLSCVELKTLFMASPTFSYKEIFEKDSYEEISEMKLNSVKFTLHEYYT